MVIFWIYNSRKLSLGRNNFGSEGDAL